VSLTARLPANLDATDWQMLIETLDAIKQCLPDAGQRQPGEVMRYVLDAIRMANAPTIGGLKPLPSAPQTDGQKCRNV
jgi:hypothetical protein